MKLNTESRDGHDQTVYIPEKDNIQVVIDRHKHLNTTRAQYNLDNPLGEVLDKCTADVKIGVDIGCGQGWASKLMSQKFDQVFAVEPSLHALETSKKLYGDTPNITWINGFAEKEIAKLKLKYPAVFYSACVLSHLDDETVGKVCAAINKTSKTGSRIAFSENWGSHFAAHLWYSRTKEWWQEQFSDWELNFRDAPGSPGGVFKGIIGVKK